MDSTQEDTSAEESDGNGKAVRPKIRLIVVSIVGIIAWALFILLYALFWSVSFTIFQNIIVAIVRLIITGLVIGLIWVVWGPPDTWKK